MINALCQAVKILSSVLGENVDEREWADATDESQTPELAVTASRHFVVSQHFRDAFACHLYMLFSVMFFMESEAKIGSGLKGGGRRQVDSSEAEEVINMRATCAEAMLAAAQSMSNNRNKLWKRGVPDETVVVLPCRIAYQMLESATGILARKASSADTALSIIAATVDSCDSLLGTILAALMDMLHSYDHMAPLCAELCCMVSERPTNRLAVELLREIGRLDTGGGNVGDGAKASGIKYVAPFIHELAHRRPRLVLANISHLLPHFDSEPYSLRSAIITALGHILEHIGKPGQASDLHAGSEQVVLDSCYSSINLEKSRETLFDILVTRAHDTSSYTRSAVLKTWISLTQSGSIPVDMIHMVTSIAIDRLHDKTVIVRKQALQVRLGGSTHEKALCYVLLTTVLMQLLTTLLENNPYMGDLDPEPYQRKLSELYTYVKENLPADIHEAHEAALLEAKRNQDSDEAIMQLEQATLAAAIAEAHSMRDSEGLSMQNNDFRSKVEALKFAQSALEFIDQYESASENLHGMLLSANTSDVTEALRFFVKARHFKLPCAITGMKQALTLMWSSEQSIKDEVLKAFVDVFIAVPGTDGTECLPDDQVAYNLLLLADKATISELASIEEAISCLVKEERIPPDVFSILWSATSKGASSSRATAIHVIAMAAHADKSIVDSKSRLKTLLDTALGDYTEDRRDWRVARAAAIALQHVERAQVDSSCAKYLVLERIMEQLCAIARGDWCLDADENDTTEWFATAEQAISALFVISPEPEVACADIIRGMHIQTLGDSSIDQCQSLRLARFFHVLGHIALKLLVYTEALSSAVRRATAKKTLQKQEEADKKKIKGTQSSEDDLIEAELGMAAEIEAENERKVAEIAEKEIVGRGLLSVFGPIIVRVVANEGNKFNCDVLRQTSTLALCKFMCVSCTFCEKHLSVIFAALANAPVEDTVLRANTVIALGDLAFRFPNEVEPYTPRMYACLRDSSTKVRRHTLMVLTHLILNDMVKVKGQVCEIALCLRDEDQRIRDTARLLFHELSKRSNNPVYNLLPDIISQLSQIKLQQEDFRSIMSFLLGYIKKERQNETLIDKLCQRFPKCATINQKADIAYCMAQLKVNERSVKTLVDHFKLYKDSLIDEEVKRHFFAIISKAKKFAKPELKQVLEEWEAKLNEEAAVGMENKRTGEKASQAKGRALRRNGKSNARIETIPEWSEGEEDEGSEKEEDDKENQENQLPIVPADAEPRKRSSRRPRSEARILEE